VAACATGGQAPDTERAAREIESMLTASAEAWSRGDLDGFMDDYADDVTYVGSTGLVRGAAQLRTRYEQGYWGNDGPPDGLRFELLDVRTLGPHVALAVGRYILVDRASGQTTATGVFSLTLTRTDEGWKIAHDHSSADGSG
jgi:beta-aspartyl-peptidase (threonine type)